MTTKETKDNDTKNLPAVPTGSELASPDEWAQLATFDDGVMTFIEHFGLSMPRLRSDFGRNGRGWIDDLTGEVYRTLDVAILATPPSRAFWIKSLAEGGTGGPPDCASRVNFRVGRPDDNVPEQQAETCGACPHSQWPEEAEGGKPRCAESVNVLAYDYDRDGMCWLRFAGTGLRPFRNYLSALLARKLPPYAVHTLVSLRDEKRDAFEWLVPVFAPGNPLSVAEVRPMREVAEKAMAMWASVADEMAAASDGPPSPSAPTPSGSEEEEPF